LFVCINVFNDDFLYFKTIDSRINKSYTVVEKQLRVKLTKYKVYQIAPIHFDYL